MFDNIILEPEQKELLCVLVETSRNTPSDQRRKFLVVQTKDGDSIIHPFIPRDKSSIYFGDIQILAQYGLLNLGIASRGSPNFDVTPIGFRYYEHLKSQTTAHIKRVEMVIKEYLNSDEFQKRYPNSYSKWAAAEELLWNAESKTKYTTIGHLCREAIQFFVDEIIMLNKFNKAPMNRSKTVERLKYIINLMNIQSKTEKYLTDALINYWGAVNDLIQRQEHGAEKEGQELIWEDARRVVFHTLYIIYEVDLIISKTK